MLNIRSTIYSAVATYSCLGRTGWQLNRVYNPLVARILQNNGFSSVEAVNIASDPAVRTISGRLRTGSALFRMGVGSNAIGDLEKAGLLSRPAAGIRLNPGGQGPRTLMPAFAGCPASQSGTSAPSRSAERNYVLSSAANDVAGPCEPVGHTGVPLHISRDLAAARDLYSKNRREEAAPIIEHAMAEITGIISRGISPEDPILSCYYAAKLLLKFLKVPDNIGSVNTERRDVVQVLILDHTRNDVLLQKRGRFKRQFPGCFCVSANAKIKSGQDINEAAAAAVKDEVGIDIDLKRLEMIGRRGQYENHLTSFNYYAFSDEEESLLLKAMQELGGTKDIAMQYDHDTRCLAVFTVDPQTDIAVMERLAGQISSVSGIPPIFSFTNTDSNSLLVYQMDETEEATARALIEDKNSRKSAAESQLAEGADKSVLKDIDSDEMVFVPWAKIRCDSVTDPERFTLVLTGPYFPNNEVWSAMGFSIPWVIDIDDPIAELACVSGGKGANTHILGKIDKRGWRRPRTSEVTTFVYEELVFNDPEIRADMELLDFENDVHKAAEIAARIRDRIMGIEIPEDLVRLIEAKFNSLGRDISVRSAATCEDMKKHQAAGQGNSCNHQTDMDSVLKSIKTVWASLFNDGFVEYRNSIGFRHSSARMAVLLQEFVDPGRSGAAGVILSFDQATQRPGYSISAQPGIGEGVVEGEGLSDKWLVGSLCDYILQRKIPVKKVRYVTVPAGGVEKQQIDMSRPSLEDGTVLGLANAAKDIHRYYSEHGLAEDMDIEYVVDDEGDIVIVQARAKRSKKSVNEEGRTIIKVRTVDESKVPAGTKVIQLSDHSETAVQGAVVSVIQLDPNRDPKSCLPHRILVTNHTNNDYNAVFGSLDGVITTDGGQTSHASEHAFEKKIPCVVGSIGALDILKDLDGQEVVFDAGKRRVYVLEPGTSRGTMESMIIEEERVLDIWLTDEDQIRGFVDEGSRHENTRPWDISKKKRPKVFIEDPEFHCRRRSNTYGHYQLDYFYRAWDRQAEILNKMFESRSPWRLVPQGRQIKAIENKHQLVHIVEVNDPQGIDNFLMGVSGFSIDDMEALFNARLDGFRKFAEFAHSLDRVDASNVDALSEAFLDIFSWMHFGFWLDSVVEEFAYQQLRYISNEGSFHKVLKEESISDMPMDYMVDPLNPSIPAGKLLNLSREKEKEVYALLETIRSLPQLRALFDQNDISAIRASLETDFPEVFGVIENWSMRYKLTLEDLDVLSDTDEYIGDLCKRLKNLSAMSEEALSNQYRAYLRVHGAGSGTVAQIKDRDSNLYLLVRSRARELAAAEKGLPADLVSSGDIDRLEQAALERLDTIDRSDNKLREAARQVLSDYPEIKKLLMVSKLQFPLREDAHHLIVPLQRIVAKKMLEAARPFVPSVLKKPEDVFNIGMEEFAALLKESDPGYVAASIERWNSLLQAEIELKRAWTFSRSDLAEIPGITEPDKLWASLTYEKGGAGYIDARGFIQDKFRHLDGWHDMELPTELGHLKRAVFDAMRSRIDSLPARLVDFERATDEAIGILGSQIAAATLPRTIDYYRSEQKRLKDRVEQMKRKFCPQGG